MVILVCSLTALAKRKMCCHSRRSQHFSKFHFDSEARFRKLTESNKTGVPATPRQLSCGDKFSPKVDPMKTNKQWWHKRPWHQVLSHHWRWWWHWWYWQSCGSHDDNPVLCYEYMVKDVIMTTDKWLHDVMITLKSMFWYLRQGMQARSIVMLRKVLFWAWKGWFWLTKTTMLGLAQNQADHHPGTGCALWRSTSSSKCQKEEAYHKVRRTIIQALAAHSGEVAICSHQQLRTDWRMTITKVSSHSLFIFLVMTHLQKQLQAAECNDECVPDCASWLISNLGKSLACTCVWPVSHWLA